MSETEDAGSGRASEVTIQITVRIAIFLYVAAFALGGWLLWEPVWKALFRPHTLAPSGPVEQFIAGMADAAFLIGPGLGILVSAALLAIGLRWYRDLGPEERVD